MRVEQLMTAPVLTIEPEASLKAVASLLVERGISGLPVCDAQNRVIGIVSEGDILFKEHDPRRGRSGGPLAWLADGGTAAVVKARARTVQEAMTSPAITIRPSASVAEAARLMTARRVNRLPVVHDGELVGIVTRADLVRAFTRSDKEIEAEVRDDVLVRTLWLDPGGAAVEIEVEDGVVALSGTLQTRGDVVLLERMTARVPGVVSVVSGLQWKVDDTRRRDRIGA